MLMVLLPRQGDCGCGYFSRSLSRNSKLETRKLSRLLQQHFPDLDLSAAAQKTAAADISADSILETRNAELETAFAEKESAFCPLPSANCLPDLDLSAAAVSLAEKDPKNQRDTSATLPRQAAPHDKNILEIQQDDCYEKSCAKYPSVGRESERAYRHFGKRSASCRCGGSSSLRLNSKLLSLKKNLPLPSAFCQLSS